MITIHFDFNNVRENSDLEQLNALLNTMSLQDLRLEDEAGYLCTSKDGEGQLLGRRYGLAEGTLHCKLARQKPGYHYRMDSFVEKRNDDHQERIGQWRKAHPDRSLCYAVVVEFDEGQGYLLIHRSSESL